MQISGLRCAMRSAASDAPLRPAQFTYGQHRRGCVCVRRRLGAGRLLILRRRIGCEALKHAKPAREKEQRQPGNRRASAGGRWVRIFRLRAMLRRAEKRSRRPRTGLDARSAARVREEMLPAWSHAVSRSGIARRQNDQATGPALQIGGNSKGRRFCAGSPSSKRLGNNGRRASQNSAALWQATFNLPRTCGYFLWLPRPPHLITRKRFGVSQCPPAAKTGFLPLLRSVDRPRNLRTNG